MNPLFRKFAWWKHRPTKDDELREELEFHLAQEAEERQAEGLRAEEARYAARRDFGNIAQVAENTRSVWTWNFRETLAQDLRYAWRTMSKNRAFTALAVLSLALGIGANTAIFSFMDSILLRSLPVADPESLAVVNWHAKSAKWGEFVMHAISGNDWEDPQSGVGSGIFPYPAFELIQKNDSVFSSVFAYYPARNLNLTIKGQGELTNGEYVSGEYFRGLAVRPAAGRMIVPDDDRAGAPAVAVVSYAFGQKHFGIEASAATGQSILVNNLPFTVVGVAPPEFFGVDPAAAPDVYLPLHTNVPLGASEPYGFKPDNYLDRNYYWIEMMGRLRPGVSLPQAQATLGELFHQWVATTASNDRERENLPALTLKEGAGGLGSLRRQYSKPLYVLMTLVALILAIACANVANLLLSRAAARRREIALRLSVGASRPRVVRQLLTESVLLASLGGALGVVFALWGMRFLALMLSNGDTPSGLQADLNWRVLGVAIALTLLTGVVFGLAPAIQSTKVDVLSALKETRAGLPPGRRRFWGVSLSQMLVIGQIAISLLLLVAAGLFVRTLTNLKSVELGFNQENILQFELNARRAGHKDPEIANFYGALQERFAAIPGVRNATLSHASLIGAGTGYSISVEGAKPNSKNRVLSIGPGFFKTMQIPMLLGREIDDHDQPGSLPVAVVNEFFVKANCGDRNPIGLHLKVLGEPREMEIVGVSKNARYGSLTDAFRPVIYIPYNQGFPKPQGMVYSLRTAGDPLAPVKTVREIVRQADPRVPVTQVETMTAHIDQTINQEIVFAELCTAFAILALVIASVGLYGTVSYNVSRRTSEIGIRMALGAERRAVIWMVLRTVMLLVIAGLGISVPIALGASKLFQSFLFGMKPNDPLSLAAAVAILTAAAAAASYAPARKASRIDPMIALRHE